MILHRQQEQGWGAQVITRLSADLRAALPDQSGLSPRNLQYMCTMARAWPDTNHAAAAAQLPWDHVMVLLDRLDDPGLRTWYADHALTEGWSRGVLEDRITGHLHDWSMTDAMSVGLGLWLLRGGLGSGYAAGVGCPGGAREPGESPGLTRSGMGDGLSNTTG